MDYQWFLDILEQEGGVMDTDFVTLNYITLDELNALEADGVVDRVVTSMIDVIYSRTA